MPGTAARPDAKAGMGRGTGKPKKPSEPLGCPFCAGCGRGVCCSLPELEGAVPASLLMA